MTNQKGKTNATTPGVSKPAPTKARSKATAPRANHATDRSRLQARAETALRGDVPVLRPEPSEPVRGDYVFVDRDNGRATAMVQPTRRAVPPLSRLRDGRAERIVRRKPFNRRRYVNASVVIGITGIGLVFAALILQRVDIPLAIFGGFIWGLFAWVG